MPRLSPTFAIYKRFILLLLGKFKKNADRHVVPLKLVSIFVWFDNLLLVDMYVFSSNLVINRGV